MMARTGRELAIVHGPQLAAQGLLGDGDPELLPDPGDEVDQAPAHHAVNRRDRARIDPGHQGRAMRIGELGGLAGRLAVDQALGPLGVELHHPVPHDLHRDPANPSRLSAGCPLIDRGQGQKAPRLRAVLRRAGDRAQRMGIKVCPERNRHGEPPSFATLNQTCLKPTRPNRVTPSGTWYKGKRRAYAYYRCCGSDAYRFGGERLCANPQVRTDRLDEAVWREVERVLQDPSWIAAEYERRLVQARDPTAGDLAGIEAQIAKLRRGMGRLIDGYAEGLIDKADFEPRVAGLRQRIKTWEEQATTLRDEVAQRAALSLIVGRLQDFARQVRDRMSAVDWSLQRDLIRVLVKRVEIDREDVNVVLRVTPSPIGPGSHGPGGERVLHHRGRGDEPAALGHLHEPLPQALAAHQTRRSFPGARHHLCR